MHTMLSGLTENDFVATPVMDTVTVASVTPVIFSVPFGGMMV